MPAINLDIVYDLVTGHRVGLERFSTGVVKKINKLLLDAQGEVDTAIAKILGRYRAGYELDTTVLQRMSVLAQQLRGLLAEAYGAMHSELKTELVAVAKHEAEWAAATYSKALSIKGALDLPSARLLEAIVTSRPFQGRILEDWSKQLEQGALHRVIQDINLGLVEGEGIGRIRDRLVDHALVTNKRSAEAVVRTAVNHVTNRAPSSMAKENPRLFPNYRWHSVLDMRTSPMCRSRAGQVYETGKGPGEELTLEQLKQRERAAWKRAGLE